MQKEFAQYILDLEAALAATHQAEDRSTYKTYLAEAGIILAHLVVGISKDALHELLRSHDRAWGNTWLKDPAYEKPLNSYEHFKITIGYHS